MILDRPFRHAKRMGDFLVGKSPSHFAWRAVLVMTS
jgi:hypothetical protein